MARFSDPVVKGGLSFWNKLKHQVISAAQGAPRWELLEPATASGSLVIRKLVRRALASWRSMVFCRRRRSAAERCWRPCGEHARGERASAHCRCTGHDRDQFRAGRGANRRGLDAAAPAKGQEETQTAEGRPNSGGRLVAASGTARARSVRPLGRHLRRNG
jgi:hypothetical protein